MLQIYLGGLYTSLYMVHIGFVGCHEISWHCLKKICELANESGDKVISVFNLTKEEGMRHSSYVNFDTLQQKFGFELRYVTDLTDNDTLKSLQDSKLDVLFIIGWHRIVPQTVLDTATICLGIHSSILPKDRGSSPINWQIIRGVKEGGVTLFHLTTGVDSGPIVDWSRYEISDTDDIRTVYFKAITSSLTLLEQNWSDIHQMKPKSQAQQESEATYNKRRKPKDGLIDWSQNSIQCYNWIRALTHPYPGAFTYWHDKKLLLWASKPNDMHEGIPGEIMLTGEKIVVSTGNKCLELLSLQMENEPVCNAVLFTKSYKLKKGDIFSNLAAT
jgi:methionyl-tRNA formyltransferase